MRQSESFVKTLKEVSKDETSKNAQLLTRGGFIFKNSAGVYSFLPLGFRVLKNIEKIIREEMNKIGGLEIFMPALVDRKYLEATGRFNTDIGFDVFGKKEKKPNFSLGWTHEEVLTAIASRYVSSYKDLPFAAYQIQTKFRNEHRAKSGLLRGREFMMKDLYSFHETEKDFFKYYKTAGEAYMKVFERCGLRAFYTLAGGGDFTASNTHEFQVLSKVGEDTIFYCDKCGYAENKEITNAKTGDKCKDCGGAIIEANSIEVGNIFPLGTRYSKLLNLVFKDKDGVLRNVVMGSYGIGVSRLLAAVVETHNDEKGIIWPEEIAPFRAHLLFLPSDNPKIKEEADRLYGLLQKKGAEVLYDDRADSSAGEKFADSDLLGIPTRIVVSEKTVEKDSVEIKRRESLGSELVGLDRAVSKF